MDLRSTIGSGGKTRGTCRGASSVYANISPILRLHRNRRTPTNFPLDRGGIVIEHATPRVQSHLSLIPNP